MPFFTFSNADIRFAKKGLAWRSHMTVEALPIPERVELIDKREFLATTLVETEETVMVPIVILTEYSDHTSIFSSVHPGASQYAKGFPADHSRCTRDRTATETPLPSIEELHNTKALSPAHRVGSDKFSTSHYSGYACFGNVSAPDFAAKLSKHIAIIQ